METFCGELRDLLKEGNRPVDTILTPPLMNRKQNMSSAKNFMKTMLVLLVTPEVRFR